MCFFSKLKRHALTKNKNFGEAHTGLFPGIRIPQVDCALARRGGPASTFFLKLQGPMPASAECSGASRDCIKGLHQSIHATASPWVWRLCGTALAAQGHRLSTPQQRWVAGIDRSRARQGMARLPNRAVVPCSASAAAKVHAGVLAAPWSLCPIASHAA